MGFLNDIRDGDFTGLRRAFGKGRKHSIPLPIGVEIQDDGGGEQGSLRSGGRRKSQGMGMGLGGGGGLKRGGGGGGHVGVVMDDDDTSPVQVGIRGAAAFFLLINLFIYIAIAAFQRSNKVGPSGLTGLSIFVICQALLHAIVFLAVPQIYERTDSLKGVARAIRLTRVQFIVYGTQTCLAFVLAMATTISANTAGCKDPTKDPHADDEDYVAKLGGFCRNKRAAAAFWWFTLASFGALLGLAAKSWYSIRKLGPRHPTFEPPASAHGVEPSAFDDHEDPFTDPGHMDDPGYEAVGSRPSNAGGYYGERPVFEAAQAGPPPGYGHAAGAGGPQRGDEGGVPYQPPGSAGYRDPFDEIRAQIYSSGR